MNFINISEEFGPRLKQLLRSKGITQTKFGDDAKIHKGLISRYLNGERPSGDFIFKVATYFPDHINYLFFGESIDRVEESGATYNKSPIDLINEIEIQLSELKKVLTQ